MSAPFAFFLAHAAPDKAWARQLYDALAPEPCFLDAATVRLGETWDRTIADAQAASRATVVLVSAAAEAAYYLGEEVDRAIWFMRHEAHRVFPVYKDGLPGGPREVPYGLFRSQGLDGAKLGPVGVADALRSALSLVSPSPSGSSPVLRAMRATKQQLYAAACMLLPSMLEDLADVRLEAPMEHLRTTTRAALALDLVNWAKLQGDPTLMEMERYLRAKAPKGFE